jgi:SagB-type dehydrogenase family enzyme
MWSSSGSAYELLYLKKHSNLRDDQMTEGIGDRFQKETGYSRNRMPKGGLDWANKPKVYKTYPDSEKVPLPQPLGGEMAFDRILRTRRSIRQFTNEPLSLDHLSYLLWATTGIQRIEMDYEFRTVPSAGALFPIETYVMANRVTDVQKGLYHYSIRDHQLETLKIGDFTLDMANAALGQVMVRDAQATFIWTAVLERSKWKYKQRAYRYIYLDSGHMGQNLALAAVSLNLGSCQIGALFDEEVNALLDLDEKNETAVYMTVVGHPR